MASPILYSISKGKELKASAMRVKPPAIRRRGVDSRSLYQAIGCACPDVEITVTLHAHGKPSASTFHVERGRGPRRVHMPIAALTWKDAGAPRSCGRG